MYSTCIFCPASLGRNRALEHFPVGRRIAFDLARGRIWAVCPRCGRWNLCPFDERWEALDDCARLSETAQVQESTSDISLLRHRSGLSLILVGRPTLGELVNWRYARNLVRRRRGFVVAMAALGTAGAVSLLGVAAGGGGAFSLLGAVGTIRLMWERSRPVIDVTTEDGTRLRITTPSSRALCFGPDQSAGVTLRVRTKNAGFQDVSGPDAARSAAREIAEKGGSEGLLESVASDAALHRRSVLFGDERYPRREGAIYNFPKNIQLGLEAASQMRQEDLVLSGEMRSVLAEWRSARELGEISDRLLEPLGWDDFKRAHRPDKSV